MKLVAVINLSADSPQQDSVITQSSAVIPSIQALFAQGADYVDIGARSSSSRTQQDDALEMQLLDPVIMAADAQQIKPLSIDTWSIDTVLRYHPFVEVINYTSTYFPPQLLAALADSAVQLVVNYLPARNPYHLRTVAYTSFHIQALMTYFTETLELLAKNRVKVLAIDPNLGIWHPQVPRADKPAIQEKIIEYIPQLKTLAPIFIVAPRVTREHTHGTLNVALTTRLIELKVDFIRTHDLHQVQQLIENNKNR